jgi:hypothetical protein
MIKIDIFVTNSCQNVKKHDFLGQKCDFLAKKVKKHDMCEKSLLKPVRAVFLK